MPASAGRALEAGHQGQQKSVTAITAADAYQSRAADAVWGEIGSAKEGYCKHR